MNLQTDKQERAPGGRFGAKLPPPAPPTATEQLAALQALRDAQGGFLVPPPANINHINHARMVEPQGSDTLRRPNDAWLELFAWFEAIVTADGALADLDKAWAVWAPPIWPGGTHPRAVARDAFDQLKARAGQQTTDLRRRAELERAADHRAAAQVLHERRAPFVAAVAAAEAALAKAKQELEAIR